jgi:NAD(P)-dependent dehydrogenase (short-subunit alcohol dehydrogenase family)
MEGLKNKVCIILGGASEIAGACAVRLASEGVGILLADYSEDGLVANKQLIDSGKVEYFVIRNFDEDSLKDLYKYTRDKLGEPSILINDNTVYGINPSGEINTEYRQLDMFERLKNLYDYHNFFISRFKESGGGSIINILSIQALRGLPEDGAFSALQGGILSLTKNLSAQYAPDDIRINSILAGFIKTEEYRKSRLNKEPEYEKKLIRHIPLKRLGTPEEVSGLATFLASDEASYISGAVIPVDGGYSGV